MKSWSHLRGVWICCFPSPITQNSLVPQLSSLFGCVFSFCFHYSILWFLSNKLWKLKTHFGCFQVIMAFFVILLNHHKPITHRHHKHHSITGPLTLKSFIVSNHHGFQLSSSSCRGPCSLTFDFPLSSSKLHPIFETLFLFYLLSIYLLNFLFFLWAESSFLCNFLWI